MRILTKRAKNTFKLYLLLFQLSQGKVKVKCTLVQALRLCTGRTAHRASRGIALLFHDHGTRTGWGISVTDRPLFTPGKDPGTHCTGGWLGPRAGLDRSGKSRPPLGFNPRTVQPVASRYTDWATRPTYYISACCNYVYIKNFIKLSLHCLTQDHYTSSVHCFNTLRAGDADLRF